MFRLVVLPCFELCKFIVFMQIKGAPSSDTFPCSYTSTIIIIIGFMYATSLLIIGDFGNYTIK